MEESVLFAKSLAMLVQEVRAQANPEALKTLLAQARAHSRARGLTLEMRSGALFVDGQPSGAGGLDALVEALRNHGVAKVVVAEGASPKEMLQLALMLAKAAPSDASATSIFDEARDLSLWYVRLSPEARDDGEATISHGARELGALDADNAARKSAQLIQQIHEGAVANDSLRTTALLRLVMDAERVAKGEARVLWSRAFDSAATPPVLKLVVEQLPDAGDDRASSIALLRRAGEAAGNALINALMAAAKLEARRVYFDAIVEIRTGVAMLIDMLRHPQWYVVRNAALLLGEMRATEAERALGLLMSHSDVRVRIAATTALAQIDTHNARIALQQGLRDDAAEVRRRSLRGFSGEQGGTSSAALLSALENERDPEVQLEILSAMGRMRSPDAVQKLIRLCAPTASSSPAAFRIAAAEALTTARGHAAIPFLRAMLEDRDVNVRTSARALINSVAGR